jgi:hypothetical protein
MGSERLPLRQCGIYRNLPTFDASITGLKALVIGATGISGFNTMRSVGFARTMGDNLCGIP